MATVQVGHYINTIVKRISIKPAGEFRRINKEYAYENDQCQAHSEIIFLVHSNKHVFPYKKAFHTHGVDGLTTSVS